MITVINRLQAHTLILLCCFVLVSCDKHAQLADGHYKYVAIDGQINVYDMIDNHKLVRTISVLGMKYPRGIAANSETDRIYIAHFGYRAIFNRLRSLVGMERKKEGYLVAVDLRTEKVIWNNAYEPSIDSLAITPDGKTLYMPSGEDVYDVGFWFVLDGETGEEKDRIEFVAGSHNTIVNEDGSLAYLASLQHNFLGVADTSDNELVRKIGPFSDSIRPFTINRDESLAFVTVNFLSGFEVADLETGDVLPTVQVEGFPWENPPLPFHQSHGISLTPDESEVWVVDAHNRHVHVFDVTGLPESAPIQIASIDVADKEDPRNLPKWINSSRDGRFMHLSTGAIIDTVSRQIVAHTLPSRYFVEIEMADGQPIQAYSRYGLGYANPAAIAK